ncbi:thymidylate kinase [Canarypox virus]|uniref:Thymidylate kinase n=2 Tax=Canarypox virus TaxID=44088 RepID=A0A1V0QGB5_CNPV|nr:thymidylate kinase [Canarypox virus]AAR83516.1 CNPV170 thymidylate kinase [Canarypox virus]ARE67394.1 SWPV2-ORF158 [Shearwaterpox virus]AWD84646.1 thymidylate kinase [Canarypox virus]
MQRGMFIVLEGLDRSGKTVQCEKLLQYMLEKGYKTESLKFPNRETEIGKVINSYLEKKININDRAIHLLFSANRWELADLIKDKLSHNINLIVDRYAFSGAAFTAAKNNVSLEWCKLTDSGLPLPDLVIFLDISASESSDRENFGMERYETASFQDEVRKRFYDLIKGTDSINWKVIDATKTIEDIHEEIKLLVEDVIDKLNDPIGSLWTFL